MLGKSTSRNDVEVSIRSLMLNSTRPTSTVGCDALNRFIAHALELSASQAEWAAWELIKAAYNDLDSDLLKPAKKRPLLSSRMMLALGDDLPNKRQDLVPYTSITFEQACVESDVGISAPNFDAKGHRQAMAGAVSPGWRDRTNWTGGNRGTEAAAAALYDRIEELLSNETLRDYIIVQAKRRYTGECMAVPVVSASGNLSATSDTDELSDLHDSSSQKESAKLRKLYSSWRPRPRRDGIRLAILLVLVPALLLGGIGYAVWKISKQTNPTEVLLLKPPETATADSVDPRVRDYNALTCALTSRSSARNDAHTCVSFGLVYDPCFDTGTDAVNCITPYGAPAFDGVRKAIWREFSFERSGQTGKLAADTVRDRSYPWRIEISHDGQAIYCNWPLGVGVAFVSENPTWDCRERGFVSKRLLDTEGFIEGRDSRLFVMENDGDADRGGSALSLKMNESTWFVDYAPSGATEFSRKPVTRAWY